MKRWLVLATILTTLLVSPLAKAWPRETRDAAARGADRLLSIQNGDGSFPWYVSDPTAYQNVQGVTAIALVDAFKVSLTTAYLDAATANRNWLANYRANGPCQSPPFTPPCRLSASNIYFLAELALVTLNPADFALARAALDDRVTQFGTPAGIVTGIITARLNQGHTNLGLWDSALFVRAAQDVGRTAQADEMAAALATQTIVDELDSSANWYELGLAGVLLGLSEADWITYKSETDGAATALRAVQAEDGSFPVTYGGIVYDGDVQATAYAVMGLAAVLDIDAAIRGANALASIQNLDGSFPLAFDGSGDEIGEVDAEAVSALVAATLAVPNGALAYADEARSAL
ncbi:MAG: hypothetical protein ACRDJM_04675 [Actinomycetota bacterium]